jgi:integrase/recombinase XerD
MNIQLKLFPAMPKISFYGRANNDKSKTTVLYCRVVINKTYSEFSLGEKINRQYLKDGKYKCPENLENKIINQIMENCKYQLRQFALSIDTNFLTAQEFIKQAKNKNTPESTLVELIENFIEHQKTYQEESTIKNHKIKLSNLELYQKKVSKIFNASNFDSVQATKFIEWFQKEKETTNKTTANRNITFYREALKFAFKKGKIKENLLFFFSGERDSKEIPVALNIEEVVELENKTFTNPTYQKIRDLFLFQCYTGLSYIDLYRFEMNTETNTITGQRGKNDNPFLIPLSEKAISILNKYDGKLPKYQNAPYNRIIKELAIHCNIQKKITTHTGRKTFATLSLADGWSLESIKMMLGHKRLATTETHYIGVNFERVIKEFEAKKNVS